VGLLAVVKCNGADPEEPTIEADVSNCVCRTGKVQLGKD